MCLIPRVVVLKVLPSDPRQCARRRPVHRRRGRQQSDQSPSPGITFGGVKDSGYGSEGGSEAIEAFLKVEMIAQMGL